MESPLGVSLTKTNAIKELPLFLESLEFYVVAKALMETANHYNHSRLSVLRYYPDFLIIVTEKKETNEL